MLVGVRSDDFTPLLTRKTIEESESVNVHKRLLSKVGELGVPCVLVFENEIYLTRSLADVNNNEIKHLVMTNTDWDILILNKLSTNLQVTLSDVAGYNLIKKIDQPCQFDKVCDRVYIASARVMEKIKLGESVDYLSVYVYTNPFINNLISKSASNKYSVGVVTNISVLRPVEIKYTWTELLV